MSVNIKYSNQSVKLPDNMAKRTTPRLNISKAPSQIKGLFPERSNVDSPRLWLSLKLRRTSNADMACMIQKDPLIHAPDAGNKFQQILAAQWNAEKLERLKLRPRCALQEQDKLVYLHLLLSTRKRANIKVRKENC